MTPEEEKARHAKHTPGPWVIGKNIQFPMSGPVVRAADDVQTIVAHVQYDRDARLIAAAPELLAALKDILTGLEHAGCSSPHCSGTCHYCATRRRARAAIKKATGEE
jgi:hypothetical protein